MHGRDHLPGGSDPIPASPSDLQAAEGIYHSVTATIDAAGSANLSWVYESGDAVFDLTNPIFPTVTNATGTKATHIVSITFSSSDTNWTQDAELIGIINWGGGSYQQSAWQGAKAGADGTVPIACVAGPKLITAPGSFTVEFRNTDGIDHTFQAVHIVAVREFVF